MSHDSADDKPVMMPNELLEAVLMNDTRNVSVLVQECGVARIQWQRNIIRKCFNTPFSWCTAEVQPLRARRQCVSNV